MLVLLTLERKQKILFKFVSNSHISLSYLLIRDWNDKYVRIFSRSSLENLTGFQTRMAKVFSDQNGAKTLPDGAANTYIAYIRE